MLTIDGSLGEGGGQILRSALALSVCLRRPFRIVNIRARRPKPGLRPQHLAAVRAAAEISGAHVEGATIGAKMLTFEPGAISAGAHRFTIGTAGSTMLVLQTVLPALLTASSGSGCSSKAARTTPPTFSASRVRTAFDRPYGAANRDRSSAPASSPRAAASCTCESSPCRGSILCTSRPGAHCCASRLKYC
jgi:hypothetical protein